MNRKDRRQAHKKAKEFINGEFVPKNQRMQMADRAAKRAQKEAKILGDTIASIIIDEVKEDVVVQEETE